MTTTQTSAHPLIAAKRVTGTAVYNTAGDRIGHIEDLSIHKVTGQVVYALMSFGGFLGLAEKYHPLPWSVLTYDTDKDGYVVPLDKAELEAAPSFAKEELDAFGEERQVSLFAYYAPFGAVPYW